MLPLRVYSIGVLLFGGYLLVKHRRGKASTTIGLRGQSIDTTYLSIGVLSLVWPVYALAWLSLQFVSKDRFNRIYGAWWRRRGFYYENVRQPDGTYRCIMMPFDGTGPCKLCAKIAPKMCIGEGDEPPSTETCARHRHAFLCPEHRTDEVIDGLLRQAEDKPEDAERVRAVT